jgi:hypothetical protein
MENVIPRSAAFIAAGPLACQTEIVLRAATARVGVVGSAAMAGQDIRSFVAAYERAHPGEVVRVTDRVSLDEDVMAVVLEYERRRRYPILVFDQVGDHDIPIVCNVVASRSALAFALGVDERGLAREYARRITDYVKPVVVPDPPFRDDAATDPALLPARRRTLPDGRHARRPRSGHRRRDRGLPSLPAQGA